MTKLFLAITMTLLSLSLLISISPAQELLQPAIPKPGGPSTRWVTQPGRHWSFAGEKLGTVPQGWKVLSGSWELTADSSAPSHGNVISMTKREVATPFNLIVAEGEKYRNVDLSVRMKSVAGQEDQGGGLVWCAKDAQNYYIVRYNPLEGDLALFKVIDGKRELITSVPAKSALVIGEPWCKLRVVKAGDNIWCYLNDERLIDASDDSLPDFGRVGLWTKADAQTSFDGFISALFAPPDTRAELAKVAFVGFHDRAVDSMAEASADVDLPLLLIPMYQGDTPVSTMREQGNLDFTKYDLIYVLDMSEAAAHLLGDKLRAAKKAKPALRIVQLDKRGRTDELVQDKIMEIDPQVTEYWRAYGPENLKRLLIYSKVKYLGGTGEVRPPLTPFKAGFFHPDAPRTFATWAEYDAWDKARPGFTAGRQSAAMFIQRDYIVYDNHAVYDAVTKELEGRGIRVISIFGTSRDMQRMLLECRPNIMLLQHHSGPEDVGESGEKPFLEKLGIPYLFCSGMVGAMTIDGWEGDIRGIKTGRWYGEMARHEYFGIIEPFLVGLRGRTAYGFSMDEPVMERVHRFGDRVEGWLRLQRTPDTDKKVAVIYFHHTLGKADIGRPAQEMSRYLDPIASLVKLLAEMKKAGYTVNNSPMTSEALLDLMKKSGRNVASWSPGDLDELVREGNPVLIPEKQYLKWYNDKLSPANRAIVEKAHGAAPGNLMVTEKAGAKYIVLPAIQLGNIVLAPQPDRGNLQDQALIHSRTVPPPHNYLAFYWWLQEGFHADAMIHFGTHGSEFYLPGKEIFLSGEDFPDIITGSMPNFDVWTVTNVGEALIAKRRSYAVIVDHLTPPILATARTQAAKTLGDLLNKVQGTTDGSVREGLLRELEAEVRTSSIASEAQVTLAGGQRITELQIDTLSTHISHLDQSTYQEGMHILGTPMPENREIAFVTQIVARNTDLLKKLATDPREAELKGREIIKSILIDHAAPPKDIDLKSELALARQVYDGLNGVGAEITNLFAGLDGKFVPTGPGGDPISRPDAIPTGRNIYGLSPAEIPSRQAWTLGQKLTDNFLASYRTKSGRYPTQLAFTMTGMETFRDMGVMEAQVLSLLGVKPEWNAGGSVVDLHLIPRAELNRPRIDVAMSVNSIYLKNFPQCLRLLDEAVRIAAAADEPDNAVRAHTLETRALLTSRGLPAARADELAGARVFGGAPGDNTARLIFLLPRSGTWQGSADILTLWRDTRTNIFTDTTWGESSKDVHDKVYSRTDAIISNWSDNLLGPLTNHHWTEETGGLALSVDSLTGKKVPVTVFDLRRKGDPSSSSLEETIALELRSLALNPDWIKGQMEHGYIGATQFMQIVDNTFRWNAVRDQATWNGAFDELMDIYVRDKLNLGLNLFFQSTNPHALQQIDAALLEAARKGYWKTDPATIRELATLYAESVAKNGADGGPYTGGNLSLRQYVAAALDKSTDAETKKAYLAKMDASETPSPTLSPAGETVSGQRIVQTPTSASQPSPTTAPAEVTHGSEQWIYYTAGAAVLLLLVIGFRLKVGVPR